MRVGTFSPSVLLRVARSSGVLGRHDLDVEELAVPSSPAQFRALAAGELDAVLTSPDNVLAYRFLADNPLGRTYDVRILRGIDAGMGLGLYARPGAPSVHALRGATIAVDVLASGFSFALLALLERAGLDGRTDCDVVELGSTPKRLEALVEGRCDATLLNAGNDLKADAAGMTCLGRVVEVARPYLGTVLAVAGEPTAGQRALAAALHEATGALLAGETTALATAEAHLSGLPAALAPAYVRMLADPAHGLIADGGVAGLDTVVALRQRAGGPEAAEALATALTPAGGLLAGPPYPPGSLH